MLPVCNRGCAPYGTFEGHTAGNEMKVLFRNNHLEHTFPAQNTLEGCNIHILEYHAKL
jgi:hypothetical protein